MQGWVFVTDWDGALNVVEEKLPDSVVVVEVTEPVRNVTVLVVRVVLAVLLPSVALSVAREVSRFGISPNVVPRLIVEDRDW